MRSDRCILRPGALLFLFGFAFLAGASDADLLRDAMKASARATYTATGKLDDGSSVIYSRLVTGDGQVLKKVIEAKPGSRTAKDAVVQNADGVFATIKGHAKTISWASELTMWDDLFRAIHPNELAELTYTTGNVRHAGRDCFKITVRRPVDREAEAPAAHFGQVPDRRPAARVFTVDQETLVILRRQHFDGDSRMTFDLGYDAIDFRNLPQPEEFATPEGVQGKELSTLSRARTSVSREFFRDDGPGWFSSAAERIGRGLTGAFFFLCANPLIFIGLGAVAFTLAAVLKLYQRKAFRSQVRVRRR